MRSCPSCHQTLDAEQLHGESIDRCPACKGLWLDHSELGPIVRQAQTTSSESTAVSSVQGGLRCPACDEPMTPFNYAHDSDVFINRCNSCNGVWLEAGQLQQIARYREGSPAVQQLGNAMADDIRTANRWQLAKQMIRSRTLSGIVALSYVVLVVLTKANPRAVFESICFAILPIAFIWFADEIERLPLGRGRITHKTPGDWVAVTGWLVLLSRFVFIAIPLLN